VSTSRLSVRLTQSYRFLLYNIACLSVCLQFGILARLFRFLSVYLLHSTSKRTVCIHDLSSSYVPSMFSSDRFNHFQFAQHIITVVFSRVPRFDQSQIADKLARTWRGEARAPRRMRPPIANHNPNLIMRDQS